jgi:hypothetical protein
MFNVGDLVKVHPSILTNEALGFEPAQVSGLLVINELDGEWHGFPSYEVKNSDGETFGLLGTSLEAV